MATTFSREGTAWAVAGCPWIDHWFNHYAGQDAAHIERALFSYAPGCAGAKAAEACIPIAAARVREAVRRWTHPGGAQPSEASGETKTTPGAKDSSGNNAVTTTVKGDARASKVASDLHALALTVGRDVVFATRARMLNTRPER